jgi:transposase
MTDLFSASSRDELIKECIKLEKENEELRKEKEALEKKLRKYENPDTPPSARPRPAGSHHAASVKKRGAPKGHPGTTRARREPHEERHISSTACPNCHGTDIDVIGQRRQQQEEMPPEIKPKVVNVVRDACRCNSCGLKYFLARDGRTPIQGKFGLDVMVLVIFLKFIVRGVLRKTAGFLDAGFAMKLAPASVQAIVARAARAGEKEYEILKMKIREARLLYVDETSFSVLGKNRWVWVFRSDADILLVIRNSRGSRVLEEVLGADYAGIVVCDCWRAYDFLGNATLQRCWAHLLRRSAELESVAGRHLHEKLSLMFGEVGKFNGKERTEGERARKYGTMTARLKKLTAYYSKYGELKSVVKYADFHVESWFTCVRFPGVEPTNNYAEQAVRETVMVRKVIGAFRSEAGPRVYETLASLIATWRLQKKDLKAELHRMLAANLC